MIDPSKREQVAKAVLSYLENVDLRITTRGIWNLLLEYLKPNQDREVWFDGFLLEVVSLFDFLDEIEDIICRQPDGPATI
jgi:hypothetical protein